MKFVKRKQWVFSPFWQLSLSFPRSFLSFLRAPKEVPLGEKQESRNYLYRFPVKPGMTKKWARTILSLLLIFSLLLSSNSLLLAPIFAASSPWSETDWTGQSGTNVTTSVSGEMTITPTTNWYNTSWGYRRKITFNNADQAENLTNFPVMVKLDSTRINYANTQNSGQDIRFTDSNGTTLLSYEIEKWDESGTSTVWVEVPQIDASSATDYIYMYYGNASTSSAENAADVWGSQVRYHLNETTTTDANEFKGSGYLDTGKLSQAVSMYGNAAGTSGSNLTFPVGSQILGNNYEHVNTNQGTVSLWFRPNWSNTVESGAHTSSDPRYKEIFKIPAGSGKRLTIRYDDYWNQWRAETSGGDGAYADATLASVTAGTWYHLVIEWDTDNDISGNKNIRFYLNNAEGSSNTNAVDLGAPTDLGYIGLPTTNGLIDDFAIFDRVLTTTEISNIYNSGTGRQAGYVADPSLKFYASLDGSGTLSPVTYNLGANVDQTAYNASTNTNGNMVTDGNMEASGVDNWVDFNTPTTKEKITDSNIFSDTQSLHIVTGGVNGAKQTVNVVSGSTYTLSLWYKRASGTTRIYPTLAEGFISTACINDGTSSGWTRGECVFKATSTTSDIILTSSSGGAEYYVDNITLTPNSTNNGGMGGTYDTCNTDQACASGWQASNAEAGDIFASEDTIKHTGSASQKVQADAINEGINTSSALMTSGNWYLISVWLYGVSGTVRINDAQLADLNQIVSPPADSWTRYSFVIKTTSNRQLQIISAAGAATFYVDDVSVIPLDNVSASFQAWAPVTDAAGSNPLSVHADSDGVSSNTSGQAANAFTFDGSTGYLRQKTYDTNQGTVSYADTNTDILDTGQEFEDYDNDNGGSAEYMVVVTNSDNTTSWGYFCADDGGTQTAVYTKKACTGGAEGFTGTSPSGKTPVGYEVRKSDFQITDNFTVGAWFQMPNPNGNEYIFSKGTSTYGSTMSFQLFYSNANNLIARGRSSGGNEYLYNAWSRDNNWHFISVTRSSTPKLYLDGSEVSYDQSAIPGGTLNDLSNPFLIADSLIEAGDGLNGSIDEPFILSSALSANWIAAQYLSESDTFNTYAAEEQYYAASGNTFASTIFDSGGASDWGNLTYTATTPTNTTVSVKVRSSNSSSMSGATDWGSCTAVASGSDLTSSGGCVTDTQRYIQYYVTLTTTDPFSTPTFSDIAIAFATSQVATTLESPDDKSYTDSTRPAFKFKAGSVANTAVASYSIEIDNGYVNNTTSETKLVIDGIPVNRTSDYETEKYRAHYENFSDGDLTNNYISVSTRSSREWSANDNDGNLREGKRKWRVKAIDGTGVAYTEERMLFIDQSNPKLEIKQINDLLWSSVILGTTEGRTPESDSGPASRQGGQARMTTVQTTDKTPTVYGKITDPLEGSAYSGQTQSESGPKVASGPQSLEVKVEKETIPGVYFLDSLTNFEIKTFNWESDGKEITDNTLQTAAKAAVFAFTPQKELNSGVYRVTFTGKDKVGNTGSSSFLLKVGAWAEIATSEEQKIVEEEILKQVQEDKITEEEGKQIIENLEITKPANAPSSLFRQIVEKLLSILTSGARFVYWGVVDGVRVGVNFYVSLITTTRFLATSIRQGLMLIVRVPIEIGTRTITVVVSEASHSLRGIAVGADSFVRTSVRTIASLVNETSHFVRRISEEIGGGYNSLAQSAPGVVKTVMLAVGNGVSATRNVIASMSETTFGILKQVQDDVNVASSSVSGVLLAMTTTVGQTAADLSHYADEMRKDGITQIDRSLVQPRELVERLNHATTSFVEIVFDKEPTTISGVQVASVTDTTVVVTWTTNHLATSKINYGTTLDYGQDEQSTKKTHEHRVEITGLTPGTKYYYEVMSQNKNYVYDAHHEFTTKAE